MPRKRFASIVAALAAVAAMAAGMVAAADPAPVGPPTAVGTGGAAATVERLATQAAIDTLRRGGNAVDAAVAAAAVLGVTEPFSCGIGGGGFMVIQEHGEKKPITIDHRETAPAAMKPDSFLENGAPLAVQRRALQRPLGRRARHGARAGSGRSRSTARSRSPRRSRRRSRSRATASSSTRRSPTRSRANLDFFNDIPATAALYLDPDGTPRDVGTVFRNPDLARTYELLADRGHEGLLPRRARPGDRRHRHAPAGRAGREPRLAAGRDDARRPARLHAPQRAATHVSYRGLDVYGMGPPSSGGSTVGEALNILEGYQLSAHDPRGGAAPLPRGVALLVRRPQRVPRATRPSSTCRCAGCSRRSFAATRRALITETAAASPVAPGDPYPFNGKPGQGEAAVTSTIAGSTTHLTVSDRKGNVVSYTFTIESTGGTGLVVPGYGFLLNNELTDFNFDSLTHPNRVEGGKRPRSSMARRSCCKDGKPFLALGSPGGSMIITTVLQMLVDRDRPRPDAAAGDRRPAREPAQHGDDRAPSRRSSLEPEATALLARGHTFATTAEIGAATGIEFLPGGGVIAAAEPVRRGGGSAMVENP